jgi:DMSO/TMAO reductase YedYZ molybdopterin-dependent catalytic subunit
MQGRQNAFIAGVLAGCLALLIGFLLRIIGLAVFLPEFAADRFFSLVPGEIESAAVTTLREYAKLSAFAGFLAGTVAVYGIVGVFIQSTWSRLNLKSETVRLLVAMLIPTAIALASFQLLVIPGRVPQSAQLSLVLVGTGFLVSHLIYGFFFTPALNFLVATRPQASFRNLKGTLTKRKAILSLVSIAGALLIGSQLARLGRSAEHVEESGTISATSDIFARPQLSGMISREITPNEDFYVVSKNIIDPDVRESDWSLTVTGLVERQLTFRLPELKPFPSIKRVATLICISNEVGGDLISNAEWTGVELGNLLDMARPKNNARFLTFHCADGYTSSIPIEKAYENGAMLAYEMNGFALPSKHGFPLRAIIPNLYGMKNPKWIQRIELTENEELGYWESRGWSRTAEINSMSRIDLPLTAARIPRVIVLAGIAFAGTREIKLVEVSTDGERTWQEVATKPRMSASAWTYWAGEWTAPREGNYMLSVRAVTEDNRVQTFERTGPFPAGATGIHRISVNVEQ